MTKTMTTQKNLAYAAPKLVVYGDVKKLTAAGTAGVPEAGSMAASKLL